MEQLGLDPRSIANAIILHASERGRAVTHLAVQKLLYFAHASFLARHRRPLVRATFEAWQLGPVCRPVYDALKPNGNKPILSLIVHRDMFTGAEAVIPTPTDHLVRDHIAMVMETMGKMPAKQLVSLSHVKGGAWHVVWEKAQKGVTIGNRIEDTLTLERFAALRMRLHDDPATEELDEAPPFAGD